MNTQGGNAAQGGKEDYLDKGTHYAHSIPIPRPDF